MHFRLIHIDFLLIINELFEKPLERLIYCHILIVELRWWGRVAYIWHAIDIVLFEGVVLSGNVLFSLTKLLCVFSSNIVAIELPNANYDIF